MKIRRKYKNSNGVMARWLPSKCKVELILVDKVTWDSCCYALLGQYELMKKMS